MSDATTTPATPEPKYTFIRVNAAGYAGDPVSMLCAFDPATDILLVMKAMPYEDTERANFLRVTTQARDKVHDLLFTEDDSREAIVAFFGLDAMKLVNLAPDVQRYNPTNVIERAGMDENGMVYRFNENIQNGQYAVLIAAYVAEKQRHVGIMGEFMAESELVFTTFD